MVRGTPARGLTDPPTKLTTYSSFIKYNSCTLHRYNKIKTLKIIKNCVTKSVHKVEGIHETMLCKNFN